MIKIKITPEMLSRALARDIAAGPAYRGASIKEGKGRYYGFLGEEIVAQTVPTSILENTKNYDLRIGNATFDVKTKTRKDAPKPFWDATVDDSANHQRPDHYVFVQILAPQFLIKKSVDEIRNYEYSEAWILGYMPRSEFYEKRRHFNAGDQDPSNGITYRDGISLVSIGQLHDILRLINALKKRVA